MSQDLSPQLGWIAGRLKQEDPGLDEAQFVDSMKVVFPELRGSANQDYEDAKDLIRECVYGDKWHQALKNKRTSRREHHRLGRSHRPKGAR